MKVSDNVNMTINIGGERVRLDVPFSRQDNVRDAEKKANIIFNELRSRFPSRSVPNLLAMVVYSLALENTELENIGNEAFDLASFCDLKVKEAISAS